jgi:hypothetical protein
MQVKWMCRAEIDYILPNDLSTFKEPLVNMNAVKCRVEWRSAMLNKREYR